MTSTLVRAERPADPAEVLDTTVWSILEAAATVAPTATALVDGEHRGLRRTYAELLADAQTVAGALAATFDPGERVAVIGPSVPESLVLSYALAGAGLVLVPVNPAFRAGELAHVLGQSGCAGAFTTGPWRGHDVGATVGSLAAELPALRTVVPLAELASWAASQRPAHTGGRRPAPDDVAQIVYTSGTTGAPKGAELTHRGMTNAARLAAERFGMRAGDVYVQSMPMFHVGGQVVSFQLCQQRATAVLVPSFEPGLVLELLHEERATLTCGVPTMYLSLMEHEDFTRRDLRSLRTVSSGGAVVPVEMVRAIEDALRVQFVICFGQTEACGFISQTHLDDPDEDKAATLGPPLPAVAARVVGDDGAVVAVGEPGELQVRAPNVMRGYHDLPEETAEAVTAEGWLRTGDVVHMDGRGVLTMRGRRKDMIVRGGENLFPAEIEAVLVAHPAVAQAAVIGVPDRHWGEVPVAVVRPAPGAVVDPAALEAFARERLASFKVPRRIDVVDELPVTASGKVQKFVLRDRYI
ncbi:MAG TPA: AMP-binding protein [Acidimicrobiales bacterium]|nr:AMP-binding protein [Acidimicrobiales bacterium]